MAEKIKLVRGDNLPFVTITLTNSDTGLPMDLSDAGTSVSVYFRAAGSTTVLTTLACTKVAGGSSGQVRFNFPGSTLLVEPGAYEGEVEVSFGGQKQTVYELLKFSVRQQFA